MGSRQLAALLIAAALAAVFVAACGGQPDTENHTLPVSANALTPALTPTSSPLFGYRVDCQADGYCGLLNPGGQITAAAWLDANRMYLADLEGRIRLLNTETGTVHTVMDGLSIPQGLTALDGRLYVSDMGNVCHLIRSMEPGNEICEPQTDIMPEILRREPSARILSYHIGDAGKLGDAQIVIDGIIAWDLNHSANGLTNDGEFVYASIGHPEQDGGGEAGGRISELIAEIDFAPGRKELMGSIIRFRPGGEVEVYATGIRNTYGISIAPDGIIYGADNDARRGQTEAGQLEELNAIRLGEFYGWPYWGTNRAPAAEQVTEPVAVLEGFVSTATHANAEGVYVSYQVGNESRFVVDLFDYETFTPQRIMQRGAFFVTTILENDGLLYLAAFDGSIHIIDPAVPAANSAPITTNLSGFFFTSAKVNEIIEQGNRAVIFNSFDVYLQDNLLIYVKDACNLNEDASLRFFLHIYPREVNDLPEARRAAGYDNFDFPFEGYGWFGNGRCVAASRLPEYPIESVHTGQFHHDDPPFSRVWQGEFRIE